MGYSQNHSPIQKSKKQRSGTTISKIKRGGIIVYEEDGHGLVAAPKDLNKRYSWLDADVACENLVLNGFSDWRLPSKEELRMLYRYSEEIGGFVNGNYWGSKGHYEMTEWTLNFNTGKSDEWDNESEFHVRAVRSF